MGGAGVTFQRGLATHLEGSRYSTTISFGDIYTGISRYYVSNLIQAVVFEI